MDSEEGKDEAYVRPRVLSFDILCFSLLPYPNNIHISNRWPGYLDNSVAGGIPGGITPYESIVKEAMEEASLPADLVHKYIKAAGCISYFYQTDRGWLQPEVEFVYDMRVPKGEIDLRPMDGEVESFAVRQSSVLIAPATWRFLSRCHFQQRHLWALVEN